MKTLKDFLNEKRKDDPCWKRYEQVGMKEKNGKEVPNCVPLKENEFLDGAPAAKEAPKHFDYNLVQTNEKNQLIIKTTPEMSWILNDILKQAVAYYNQVSDDLADQAANNADYDINDQEMSGDKFNPEM